MRGRVAVIGDVAGHAAELRGELARLGAVDGRLPDDLVVVQVGDLVHRGPASEDVIRLVDGYLREQPGHWVQLVGNHEAQYVRDPVFDWPERIDGEAASTLRRWWADGDLYAAAAVRAAGREWLVTHAGLTEGYWRQALDSPSSAELAARALNSFRHTHDDVLFHAGQMLGGGAPRFTAGPVWAAAASELVDSWREAGTPLPFAQVHGHSTVTDWRRRALRCSAAVAELTEADPDRAVETVTLPGGVLVGVDPGHGRKARTPWQAFVLDDAELLVPGSAG